MISRILIFPVLALPVITGLLEIIGENREMFSSETGAVINTVIYTFCLIVLISLTAVFLRKIEQKKVASEEALKQSELKLKYHLENSPLGVIEWDKDFNVIQWSGEAEKIFGHRKEDVQGKHISTLNMIYEEDKPKTEIIMERLSSGKEIKVISQNRNYSKNGDVIECVWYNSVLFDEKGTMSSVMSLVENVTLLKRYQKELIASNEKYEELLTNARSIIVKQDTTGKLTYINEFGLQFFGFDEEEIIGKMDTDNIIPTFESTGRNLNEMIESIYSDPHMY
jgi:PAS domain S-box-containing protein